jgi:hypothetical protein
MKKNYELLSVLLPFVFYFLTISASASQLAGTGTNVTFKEDLQISGDSINIALIATPTTSMVSGWENLNAVNDGFVPKSSNDKTHTAYGNWNSPNTINWVQYDWGQVFIARAVEIYWFDDNGGVLTPTSAYIEYYKSETSQWVRLADVPCVKNTFNKVVLGEVKTQKLRVSMINTKQSTGILEFRVWGTTISGGTDIVRPTAPGTPKVLETTDTSIKVSWTKATDNEAVTGYELLKNDTVFMSVTDTFAVIANITDNRNVLLSVKAIDGSQNLSSASGSIWVYFGAASGAGKTYAWPNYSPTLNYNFKDEFPALAEPTKDLNDCPQVAGSQSSGWWTFKWGPKKRHEITEAAITPLLARLNKDFAYFRDVMGWPPDKRAKEGYRSTVYLYGSGLSCIDNADTTALGGWQSSVGAYPCILASYYPIYSFDPKCTYSDRENQMGAMVHEGIHAVLADLPGCKDAAWFQEGGNTWLQQEAAATQSNDFSTMGFLNACPYIAPFMPIECYSGWLQDGSFGGPSAEGVNMNNSSGQQICTWRKTLGGNQYGNTFPTFLGHALGKGSVAWIWRNCPGRVLEGMAGGLGDMQMRRLIMEYRAKQALIDMKEWSGAIKKLLDGNFKSSIGAEWKPNWINCTTWIATPYAKTWMLDKVNQILTPEPRTTPGWSGANQIPLVVTGDVVEVNFMPLGQNMTCQLCYRATDGTPVYSTPVSSGNCSLKLDKAPANGVVIAVICNTDYVYKGEETRKAHFKYQLQLVKGITGKASVYKKWYDYQSVITNVADPEEAFPSEGATTEIKNLPVDNSSIKVKLYPNPIDASEILNIEFSDDVKGDKTINIIGMKGDLVYSVKKFTDRNVQIPTANLLTQGMYFVNIQMVNKTDTFKVVVK